MPQLRKILEQYWQAGPSLILNLFPQSGHWTSRSTAASLTTRWRHIALPHIPRAFRAQFAPPPTTRARLMVNAVIPAARFQPSSLPRAEIVAMQGM